MTAPTPRRSSPNPDMSGFHPLIQSLLRDTLTGASYSVITHDSRNFILGIAPISAAMAEHILAHHFIINRKVKDPAIEKIRCDIVEGHFLFNGESIIFDEMGWLRDGHTRLRACKESGQSITTCFMIGIPTNVFVTLDQGDVRDLAQILKMEGEELHTVLSTALTTLAGFLATGRIKPIPKTHPRARRSEVKGLLQNHSDLRLSAAWAAEIGKKCSTRVRGVGNLAVLHYILARHDLDLAERLLLGLTKNPGFGAVPDTDEEKPQEKLEKPNRWLPAQVLFNTLADIQTQRNRPDCPDVEGVNARIIMAWNFFFNGKRPRGQRINWVPGDGFPQVTGWGYDDNNIPIDDMDSESPSSSEES